MLFRSETPDRQAALIRASIEKRGVPRAIVVAHSLAGVVATNLALDHKDFVTGLALVAPVTHPWPGGDVSWYYNVATAPMFGEAFNHTLAMPLGLALLERTLGAIFAPQTPPGDYAVRTGAARVLRPSNFSANARDVSGTYEFVTRDRKSTRLNSSHIPLSRMPSSA